MGNIIVIEGLDKSGKQTQSIKLADWLTENGHPAVRVEIPDYSTPIGKEIKASLYNMRDYSPREFQFLMLMNRYEVQSVLMSMLKDYEFLILDRYNLSGLAYGVVDGVDEQLIKNLSSNLLQPDLGILLDLPARESVARKRGEQLNDRYESDVQFLERVRINYLRLARELDYHVFDAEYHVDSIHDGIVDKVKRIFKL